MLEKSDGKRVIFLDVNKARVLLPFLLPRDEEKEEEGKAFALIGQERRDLFGHC